MARGSRLALWAGLVALSAALVTVVFAVLVPGSKAGADKGGGGHCANSAVGNDNDNGNGQHGNGHKKAHPGHDACSAGYRPELGLPSFKFPSFPTLTLTSPNHPAPLTKPKTSSHPTPPPSVASVPASRTTLTVAPSHGQTGARAQHGQPTVADPAKPPTTPRERLIEPAAYPASDNNSSVTLPGTLAAFALAVAGVVAVSGYRRRGVLLAGRRLGPGAGGRHGKPRGRHSRR